MDSITYCRFCGQHVAIDNTDGVDEVQLIERATMKCKCDEAVRYQTEVKRKAKASDNVRKLFGEQATEGKRLPQKIVDLLLKAVEMLCDDDMEKMTLNLWGGGKGHPVTE